MATLPDDRPTFDVREQLVRIDKMQVELNKTQVEIQKITQDIKLATPQMVLQLVFQGALAMAAIFGAGIALAKLFL